MHPSRFFRFTHKLYSQVSYSVFTMEITLEYDGYVFDINGIVDWGVQEPMFVRNKITKEWCVKPPTRQENVQYHYFYEIALTNVQTGATTIHPTNFPIPTLNQQYHPKQARKQEMGYPHLWQKLSKVVGAICPYLEHMELKEAEAEEKALTAELDETKPSSRIHPQFELNKIFTYRVNDFYNKTRLLDYSDQLQSCAFTLDAMGYKQEINNQHTLVKIIVKLPMYLRSKWLRSMQHNRSVNNRLPNIDDVVKFVKDSAVEANDPVYGNLCEDFHYLVEWEGWPLDACSFEPAQNITIDLLDNYSRPNVAPKLRQEALDSLYLGFQKHLKSKGNEEQPFEVSIRLDVFRSIFGHFAPEASTIRGYQAYTKENINDIGLRNSWNYLVNQHYCGKCLVFPILIKPVVVWSAKNFELQADGTITDVKPLPAEKLLIRCCTDAYKLK
ncbi:hypothetical protein GQR58_012951 [Nymphon striatum]|nr:hypothetical protein GQR58_012951 [Nymphon striatum]